MTTAAPRAAGRNRALLVRALAFAPALLAAGACVVAIAFDEAGYFPRVWYPAGMLAGGLLVVIAVARTDSAVPPPGSRAGLLLLAAWTALSGLSIAWAAVPGAAWQAADKLLATLSVAILISLAPWRPRSAWILFGAWAAAVTVIAGVDLWSFAVDERPGGWLLESRYLGPIGYANGTAALAAMAFWPALLLSARPATPWPVRLAMLPAAVLLLSWALLPSSRATVLALLVAAPIALALSHHRWRLLARMAVAGGTIAIAAGPLSEVYTASRREEPLTPVVDAMADAVVIAVLAALAASILLLVAEPRIRPSAGAMRAAGRAGRIALVAGLVCAALVAVVARGPIADGISERWDAFNSHQEENTQTGARLGQITSDKRSDYWRVALNTFRDHPLVGVGAGGFEREYTAHKRYAKHSRYAHSLWLRALSDTGILGLALLAGGVLALLGAVVRRRIAGASEPELLAAAGAAGVGFFLQCSVDWLEEVPVLTVAALALVLVALAATAPLERSPLTGRWRRAAPVLALGIVTVAALASPWLGVRWIDRGDAARASHPEAAFAAYDRAAGFNGLDPTPHMRAGFLALDLGDFPRARREFQRALDVQESWLPELELGLLDLRVGRFEAGARRIERARRLNRHDPLIAVARNAARDRRRVDPRRVNRLVLEAPVLRER